MNGFVNPHDIDTQELSATFCQIRVSTNSNLNAQLSSQARFIFTPVNSANTVSRSYIKIFLFKYRTSFSIFFHFLFVNTKKIRIFSKIKLLLLNYFLLQDLLPVSKNLKQFQNKFKIRAKILVSTTSFQIVTQNESKLSRCKNFDSFFFPQFDIHRKIL